MHRAPAAALTLSLVLSLGLPASAQESAASPVAARIDVPPAGSDPEPAPDIIVVMVDDLADIADDRVLERLPEISDLFLDSGLRLRELHTQTPLCGPSRATLLTGRNTLDHGVITNDGDPMDPSRTIATTLHEAGYHTMLVGKYLNDYEGTRQPPGWDRVSMRESPVVPSYTVDGELVRYEGRHFDDVVRTQAVDWVREAPAEEPLFALVTPRSPHRHPQQCVKGKSRPVGCQYLPAPMSEDVGAEACADLGSLKPPDYEVPRPKLAVPWGMPDWPEGWPLEPTCESLLVIDRMVGELREAQTGRDRPAWFFFLSDNGMAWGRRGSPGKHVPVSTRLPFYVAGPGVVAGASDVLLSNLDIAATIADLAGAEAPARHGSSFLALLRGEAFEGHEEVLEIMPTDPQDIYPGWAALHTPELRFVRWDDGRRELYDLVADPWEQDDLDGQRGELMKAMETRLDELIEASRSDAA